MCGQGRGPAVGRVEELLEVLVLGHLAIGAVWCRSHDGLVMDRQRMG